MSEQAHTQEALTSTAMFETPTTPMPAEEVQSPQRRFARVLSGILAASLLFASGVGIGWLVSSEPAGTATPSVQDVVDTSTSVAAGVRATEAAPNTNETPPVVTTPSIVEGEEPVADIAAAVLPSMVQISLLDSAGNQLGVGSGVVYDPDGYILTAAHVVEGTWSTLNVKLNDGTVLAAEVVGSDTANDIAVLSIDRADLPAAALAVDEQLRVGQLAIAIGSPWALDATVTAGIVSAVNRPLPSQVGQFYVNMIQTDAAINPGNSGGALVDRQGRVIGINVSIYSSTGANDGVGFAVPIDRAFRVANALTSGGQFIPGLLGVTGDYAGIDETPGAVITDVNPGSAAEDAGLLVDDVVISINDHPVTGIDDLAAQVRSYQAGDTVVLDVVRGGETIQVPVTLGAAE